MTRWILAMLAVVGLIGTETAHAQESASGPGAVVITIIPGGGTLFTEGKDTQGPSFGNYDLGAGVEVHFNRYVGVEGEVSGGLGVKQDLRFSGETLNVKPPNLLNVNRSLPDADLDAFVEDFARRVASFEKRALELGKKLVNARAGLPSEADRWGSNQSFMGTTSWPETKALLVKLMDRGLQKEGDFELRLGHHVGHVAR